MTRPSPEDVIVLRMGVDTLMASVRQAEAWWRAQGDAASLRRTRLLLHAILATRRKFFPRAGECEADGNIAEALFVADGLRDAARQCHEGQGALHERLIGGAEAIERLCGSRLHKG